MGWRRTGGEPPVLLAALLWGTVGPAQLLSGTTASPVSVGACRMLLGGLLLALLTVRGAGLRTLWAPGVRRLMLLSILVTAAFQACFLEAVDRCGAALATAVTFGTVPAVSGWCAHRTSGERPDRSWWWGTACAVGGIALLLVPGRAVRADAPGVLLGIAAGASFGVYIALTGQLGRRGADTAAAAPVSVLCAGVLVSPWIAAAPQDLSSPRTLVLVGWLGIGTTALGYWLFTSGVGRTGAATAGTLSLAEPLVATVLGVALLGERPPAPAACGAALLLAGLVAVSVTPGRRPRVNGPDSASSPRGPGARRTAGRWRRTRPSPPG